MNTSVNNTPAPVNNNRVNNAAKIEDFGQKIGGARKDYYAQLRELADILAGIDCEALKKSSLSKLVKLPDLARLYEAGALSEDAARALLTIWRTIPARPSRPYRLARWAEETAEKVAQCAALLDGAAVDEKTRTRLDFQILKVANWPAVPFSFGRFSVEGPNWFASDYRVIAGGRYYSRCQKLEDVPAAIAEAIATDNEKRAEGPALAVYYTRAGQYFIAVKDKAEIVLATYDSREDARAACQNDRAALIEKYNQLRTIPALRREWNRPRVGQDWRKGQDVTPDTFAQVLPFRGVEFGNWVNQTERAALLNSAFDGFHDLAQVWGLTAEEMTLSGSLAFAFASRGIAGAAAHYEAGHEVINLTKKNGAGCMAHEWFHAVDWFAGALDGRDGLNRAQTEHPADSERGEAARELMAAIKKTDFYSRSAELAKFSKKGDYWVENCELAARGFEGVCGVILNAAGVCSDFLVNLLGMDAFTAKDALHRSSIYPYPSEAEAAELLPYYLRFLRSVFGHAEVSAEALQMAEAAHEKAEAEREAAAQVRAQREAEKKAKEEARAEELRKEAERQEAEREAKAAEIAEILSAIPGVTGARRLYCYNAGVAVAALWDAQIITVFASAQEAKTKPAAEIAAAVSVMAYKCKPARTKNPRISARDHSVEFCKKSAAEFLDWVAAGAGCSRFAYEFAELAAKHGRHAENFRAEAEKMAADIARLKAEQTQKWAQEAEKSAEQTNTKANDGKPAQKPAKGEKLNRQEIDTTAAPAESLQLVEIADGVAVIPAEGYDYRATLFNRRQIKAHGATWNKEAQQWQATDPATVEALRAWFAQSASADEQQEQAAEPATAPACYSDSEKSEISAAAALPEWLKVGAMVMTAPRTMIDSRTMRPSFVDAELMRVSAIDADFVSLEHPKGILYGNMSIATAYAADQLSPAPVADEQPEQSTDAQPEPVAIAASYGSEPEIPDAVPAAYYSGSEKSEACSLYNFSFKNRTAEQWNCLTKFDTEADGEKLLQKTAEGHGLLSASACDFLDVQADYIIYFSRRNGDYICMYLADFNGQPLRRPIEELRGRLLDARKAAELKQIAQSIQEADRDGCAYEIHAGASVVRVDRDPRTPGHFRATWYVSGELDERRKAQTAEDAAGMVWLLRESCTLEGRQFQIKRPQAGYSDSAKSEPTAAPLTDCALLVSSDENDRKQFRQRHEEFYKLSDPWHGDEVNTNRETDLREHYDRESLAVHFLLSHELFYSWTDNRHREDCLDDVRQIYPDMTADELHDIRNKYAAAVGEIYG